MASEQPTTEVNGINLANYYPSTRSFNTVVYLHKKFFDDPKVNTVPIVQNIFTKDDNPEPKNKECKKKTKDTKVKHRNKASYNTMKNFDQTSVNNDEVLGQTIRFAKNIIPIVIPPNQDATPIYYTIKTSKKSRTTQNKPKDYNITHDLTYDKQKHKKTKETFKKEKYKSQMESFSRESGSKSSKSSTIENLVINHSLTCSLSEISEKKLKKVRHVKSNKQAFVASESFEALATELLNSSGDAKIKIHLMNDTAKDMLYESIRNPIIEAIKESVTEIVKNKANPECTTVHKYVQCHTQKLDHILEKLTCIEKRLNGVEEKAKTQKIAVKASALEDLGEDIVDQREGSGSDEETSKVYSISEQQKARCASALVKLNPLLKKEDHLDLGGGEEVPSTKPASSYVQPDRANKIPARYCWTDAAK